LYYFPVQRQKNPTEYVEMIFTSKAGSPIRRVLLQDVRLPDAASVRHHHVWAVVDRLYNRHDDVREDVQVDGGTLIADGPYSIVPQSDESMLAFEFTLHDLPHGLAQRMRIKTEGMYRMFVTHPNENRRLALERPRYDPELIESFAGRHRMPVYDRRMLDRTNVEFQLAAEQKPVSHDIDDFLHEVEPGFPARHRS
jgi:hypothetical protein